MSKLGKLTLKLFELVSSIYDINSSNLEKGILMIGVRTPFRVSFSGGSTDIPLFYKKYGGKVISTSIDKYVSLHS